MTAGYDRVCEAAYYAVRRWLVPTLRNSQYAYQALLRSAIENGGGRWLDLGCGHAFLPPWFGSADRRLDLDRWQATGIDLDSRALSAHTGLKWRVRADVERLPFRAGAFDLVTANMVLEHVAEPAALFSEASRVLKPGGTLLFHTPNVRGYTTMLTRVVPERFLAPFAKWLLKRDAADVYRTYYRSNSRLVIDHLAARSGFEIETFRFVQSSPQFVRVPPLMVAEMGLIKVLENDRLSGARPCIVSVLRKAHGPAGSSAKIHPPGLTECPSRTR